MQSYIALLRAVNVGGRTVKMDRLRAAVSAQGFKNVRTYIASGNLFFDSASESKASIIKKLEAAFIEEFGFEIPVSLRTVAEVEAALKRDSFAKHPITEDTRHLVVFYPDEPAKLKLPWVSEKQDITVVDATKGELMMVLAVANGKWPTNGPAEKAFGVKNGTGRFAHTLVKIVAAAKAT